MEDAPARQTLLQPPPFRIHAVQRHKPALPIARLWLLLAQERHQEYRAYAKDKNPEKHCQRHRISLSFVIYQYTVYELVVS
jgi:hypothetical protein